MENMNKEKTKVESVHLFGARWRGTRVSLLPEPVGHHEEKTDAESNREHRVDPLEWLCGKCSAFLEAEQ